MKKMTKKLQSEIDRFNKKNPVGTPVRFWTGARQGEGVESKTRTEAQAMGNHTAVVWVEDHGACIALSHIEPVR